MRTVTVYLFFGLLQNISDHSHTTSARMLMISPFIPITTELRRLSYWSGAVTPLHNHGSTTIWVYFALDVIHKYGRRWKRSVNMLKDN